MGSEPARCVHPALPPSPSSHDRSTRKALQAAAASSLASSVASTKEDASAAPPPSSEASVELIVCRICARRSVKNVGEMIPPCRTSSVTHVDGACASLSPRRAMKMNVSCRVAKAACGTQPGSRRGLPKLHRGRRPAPAPDHGQRLKQQPGCLVPLCVRLLLAGPEYGRRGMACIRPTFLRSPPMGTVRLATYQSSVGEPPIPDRGTFFRIFLKASIPTSTPAWRIG